MSYIKNVSSTTTNKDNTVVKKQEMKEKLIQLFNSFDSHDDDVLNANDTLVKILEEILTTNKELSMDLNDDMAKYVILRNMAKIQNNPSSTSNVSFGLGINQDTVKDIEISQENILNRFDEVWDLCQNDEQALELMNQIDELFQKYSINIENINKNNNLESENIEAEAQKSYEAYRNDCEEQRIEVSITKEDYMNDFINDYGDIYSKFDDIKKIGNDYTVLYQQMMYNSDFLSEFENLYGNLKIRIQTLEQRKFNNNVINGNNNTAASQSYSKGPKFGLN